MRKTANQAKISAQAEREKPALERCCQAAEAGFDRLTGLTKLFSEFVVFPTISCSIISLFADFLIGQVWAFNYPMSEK